MAYEHQINEHERPLARALWERIFPEDTQAFLDAFFALKGDNVILGVRESEVSPRGAADCLAAMIHLDPCRLVFGRVAGEPNVVGADYVVGVSTLPEYRRRGLMAALLHEAFARGAARKDPFIFLMPANEQVYLPFGFRTVYRQTNHLAADADALAAAGRIAGPDDCAALAEAASGILAASRDTYLVRDEHYFRELIAEMGAEDGKVLRLPEGYLCFWPNDDGGALVRELVLPEARREEFLAAHGPRPAPQQPKPGLDPAPAVLRRRHHHRHVVRQVPRGVAPHLRRVRLHERQRARQLRDLHVAPLLLQPVRAEPYDLRGDRPQPAERRERALGEDGRRLRAPRRQHELPAHGQPGRQRGKRCAEHSNSHSHEPIIANSRRVMRRPPVHQETFA